MTLKLRDYEPALMYGANVEQGGDNTTDNFYVSSKGATGVTIWTNDDSQEALILPYVANAVNEITITQAATGVSPTIAATGSNSNVSIILNGKGTGRITSNASFIAKTTVTTDSTAGNLTLTAAQILGGLILRNPNGGPRTDTLPTAALLVAAIPGVIVGSSFRFTIRNTAGAAETITVASGVGGTDSGTMTIAQNNTKDFLIVITNITGAAEAYTTYSIGTFVH